MCGVVLIWNIPFNGYLYKVLYLTRDALTEHEPHFKGYRGGWVGGWVGGGGGGGL